MKRIIKLGMLFAGIAITTAQAQNEPRKEKAAVVYSSQQEKDQHIRKLETIYKINASDPTYPADRLEKEKKELDRARKGKVVHK